MRFGPLGIPEILIILVILLLLFGATRLPEIGKSLGKGIRSFKTSVTGEDEEDVKPGGEPRPVNTSRNNDDLA